MPLTKSLPGIGLRLGAALLLAAVLLGSTTARAYYAGGGKDAEKGNDCLIGYNGIDQSDVTVDGKKQLVECTDCDPTCDFDGDPTANNSCTFRIGVCLNQATASPACVRPDGLDKATAKYKAKGKGGVKGEIALEDPTKLMSSACGSFVELTDLLVELKEKKDGSFVSNKATFNLSGLVNKDKEAGTPKRKDKDKLTYVCLPRPAGEACPIPTTTTTSSTTPTTAESTTTTSSSTTTSTTQSTTTSTSSTTSTSIGPTSTTSTTVVSTTTTSTIAPPTSTTSTTVVSTTSTSVVTTTSTTTTTVDLCGNGTIDGGEQCDGTDFGDATCPGSTTGAFLECTPECTIDYSNCPVVSTTSTTTPPSTTSTSTTVETTSTSTTTVETTSTSTTTVETTSTSTTTIESTTTSTSVPPTSTSTSTTTVPTTTTTSTSIPTVLVFTTGEPTGTCGSVRSGGTGGTIRKALGCGGLNVGGGNSTVGEGPTPAGAETQMNVAGGPTYTVSGRTATETGSNRNCSDTACIFGPYLPISNSGTSTCVQNTFASPASGTLDAVTGAFTGGFPLSSAVYLTANGTDPCPRCLGGSPGVTNSGTCQVGWTSGVGPSPTENTPCTPTDSAGDTYDCVPPPAAILPAFPVDLTPITTGTAFKFNASGLFCPSQANSGAFGCSGGMGGGAPAICPNGTTAPLINYIEEVGSATGPVTAAPTATTLASTFCIPSVGGSLGFLINGAANLPGPGATSLPGTLKLL